MIVLLIISFVVGGIVAGVTGIGLLGWVAGGFIFLCGLPGVLIFSAIFSGISYSHDRADYRQIQSDLAADIRAEEHQILEDIRSNQLIDVIRNNPSRNYNDNRQVNIYGRV
jgi:hypothetical protein